MIKNLTIKGTDIEAKGTFEFGRYAEKFAKKDKDGNAGSGITAIYTGILQSETNAIVDFWECCAAGEKSIQRKHVEDAVLEAIEDNDGTLELLQGAQDVFEQSGFFREQIRTFWLNVNQSYRAAVPEEGQTVEEARMAAKEQAKMLNVMRESIRTGVNPEDEEETA